MSGASVESASPRLRRTFTAADKRRIVKAAAVATASGERGAIEALLRKEGIYSSLLSAWRQQLAAGGTSALEPQKPGRKAKLDTKDRELLALTKRNAELERKLALANAVIGLQKKCTRSWGLPFRRSTRRADGGDSRSGSHHPDRRRVRRARAQSSHPVPRPVLGSQAGAAAPALARASAIGLDAAAIERLTDDELEAAPCPKTVAAAGRAVPDCASRRSAACQSTVKASEACAWLRERGA